jgi:hypothetical protein
MKLYIPATLADERMDHSSSLYSSMLRISQLLPKRLIRKYATSLYVCQSSIYLLDYPFFVIELFCDSLLDDRSSGAPRDGGDFFEPLNHGLRQIYSVTHSVTLLISFNAPNSTPNNAQVDILPHLNDETVAA